MRCDHEVLELGFLRLLKQLHCSTIASHSRNIIQIRLWSCWYNKWSPFAYLGHTMGYLHVTLSWMRQLSWETRARIVMEKTHFWPRLVEPLAWLQPPPEAGLPAKAWQHCDLAEIFHVKSVEIWCQELEKIHLPLATEISGRNNCWISRLVGFFGGSSRLAWLSCVGPFATIEDYGFGGWRGKKWCWFGEVWTAWSSFLHQLCPWSLASTTGPPGHLFQWRYSHPGGSLMPFDLMWKTLWWRTCAKNSRWVTRRDFSIEAPWRFSCAWSRWWGWSASTGSTLAHGKSESVPLLLHQLLHQQRDLANIFVEGKVTFQFSYEVCTYVSTIVVPCVPLAARAPKAFIFFGSTMWSPSGDVEGDRRNRAE